LDFSARKVGPKQYNLAECERARLRIKLSALRQVRLALAEVVELEQVGGALA